MIIHNSRGEPVDIRPDSEAYPSFKDLAKNPESGLHTVERQEYVNGRKYTFYDTYMGDKLIGIQ